MRDMLIDMMVAMMPAMKPLVWAALVAAVLGIIALLVGLFVKNNVTTFVTWSGRVVLTIAVFFLAAQAMGFMLSMPPTFNLGDASKFEFILVSFWKVGAALLVAGLAISYSKKFTKSAE